MISRLFGTRKREEKKESDFVIEDDEGDESGTFIESLRKNLTRLIVYAESADVKLQRDVAEKLANEAVKDERQAQIVEMGGLKLLIPLTKSTDVEVQRLAAHALANLSVNAENQQIMASQGAIEVLISLLDSTHTQTLRQSAKALANLGVCSENKRPIALAGAVTQLVRLSGGLYSVPIKIEAIAALANLAVNDLNEIEISSADGIRVILNALMQAVEIIDASSGPRDRECVNAEELLAQCARALRNLSVNSSNKKLMLELGAIQPLRSLQKHSNERIAQQSRKALMNLGCSPPSSRSEKSVSGKK